MITIDHVTIYNEHKKCCSKQCTFNTKYFTSNKYMRQGLSVVRITINVNGDCLSALYCDDCAVNILNAFKFELDPKLQVFK